MLAMKSNNSMTLADIARLAKVSQSTVSRALRDNPLIKRETREHIQALARQHNFKVNAAASKLRTRQTNTIAVVIMFDPKTGQSVSDPFLMALIGSIADELTKFGYDMLLSTTKTNNNDWYQYYIESRRADGLIILGQGAHDKRVQALVDNKVPFVVWGSNAGGMDLETIGSDNRAGGYLATKHLIDKGCKRVLFLGDVQHDEIELRWQGYQDALSEAGIKLDQQLQVCTDFTSQDGYERTREHWMIEEQGIDGIFAVSDAIAMGAMKYLLEQDVAIPDDVCVVGFDDISLSAYTAPALTTVRQYTGSGARLLVTALLKCIDGQPVKSRLLEVELVARQSSNRQSA